MANVRNSDTSLWLHNKLGISNDSWTGGSICSQLNAEVLRNIKICFPDLQTQVKLKLLLSIFHIPRRNVEEWRSELEDILEVAQGDSELWVSMLAEAMKTLPSTGSLNLDIGQNEENRRIFSDLVNDLRKLVRKQNDGGMLPLECHYLNKTALTTVVGQQPPPVKHFSLKRKPKSAALRAELLSKSQDAMNNMKKSTAPTVPVRSRGMPRKMTDTTPLKGIPSRVPTGGFRSPVLTSPNNPRAPLTRTPIGRKDGLIKLIDINEQPIGYAQSKKRKRMQELEEAQRATEAAMAAQNSVSPTAAGATVTAGTQPGLLSPPGSGNAPATPSATPDYAIGLTSLNPATPAPATPAPATPSYGNPSTATIVTIQRESPSTPSTPATPVGDTLIVQSPATTLQAPTVTVLTTSGLATLPGTPQLVQMRQSRAVPTAQATTTTTTVPVAVPVVAATLPVAGALVQATAPVPAAPSAQAVAVAPAATQPPRKRLSLTKEQLVEAQEMFQCANRVTRPEKALILGFMAGSRDNPCPDLGDIVTIKLNESQENVLQPDNTVVATIVETHFQMNYSTGEWMRIRKTRKIEEQPANAGTAPAATPQHATA